MKNQYIQLFVCAYIPLHERHNW